MRIDTIAATFVRAFDRDRSGSIEIPREARGAEPAPDAAEAAELLHLRTTAPTRPSGMRPDQPLRYWTHQFDRVGQAFDVTSLLRAMDDDGSRAVTPAEVLDYLHHFDTGRGMDARRGDGLLTGREAKAVDDHAVVKHTLEARVVGVVVRDLHADGTSTLVAHDATSERHYAVSTTSILDGRTLDGPAVFRAPWREPMVHQPAG